MKLNVIRITKLILLILALCTVIPSIAQTVKRPDYSNIHVDELTDQQVRAFMAQFGSQGLSEADLDKEALAGGMSATELEKLHARIKKANPSPNQTAGKQLNNSQDSTKNTIIDTKTEAEKALAELKSKIYGTDNFQNNTSSLIPNLSMATPLNYQIGPNDQLIINVSGNSVADWKLMVSRDGNINIPGAGILNLSGKTVEQATALIRNRLIANKYAIGRGTDLHVSLGDIRTIRVRVTGEVTMPQTYSLPSVATAFSALYASGGPNENGSFRQIEIIRDRIKIATLDVYDYLLHGDLKGDVQLQDQDIIHIPTYKTRVEVIGQVKHPAIFEMLPGEKLSDLLQFAGDFTEQAYRSRIKVYKNTGTQRKIEEIVLSDFNSYQPSNGDKYYVDKIIDRFENKVRISGAVFRPDVYELTPGLTVSQLIRKAEGLREDAFQNRGQITRLKDDLQIELVSFDVARVLAGQVADIPLKREDIVLISSISDLKEEYNVTVQGEVQRPGTFKFADRMSLEDAIIKAGGLKESAASQYIEISRRIKNSDALSVSAKTAEVFKLTVNQDLRTAAAGFILQPFDIVIVRPSSGYEVQKAVQITGEVLYPGRYTITKKDERISDLLNGSGGFTALAYPEGASLRRPGPEVKDTVEINKKLVIHVNVIVCQGFWFTFYSYCSH